MLSWPLALLLLALALKASPRKAGLERHSARVAALGWRVQSLLVLPEPEALALLLECL